MILYIFTHVLLDLGIQIQIQKYKLTLQPVVQN